MGLRDNFLTRWLRSRFIQWLKMDNQSWITRFVYKHHLYKHRETQIWPKIRRHLSHRLTSPWHTIFSFQIFQSSKFFCFNYHHFPLLFLWTQNYSPRQIIVFGFAINWYQLTNCRLHELGTAWSLWISIIIIRSKHRLNTVSARIFQNAKHQQLSAQKYRCL